MKENVILIGMLLMSACGSPQDGVGHDDTSSTSNSSKQTCIPEDQICVDSVKLNACPFEAISASLEAYTAGNQPGIVYRDLRYGDHPLQVFDLYIPEGSAPNGTVLYFHGGSFTSGDKSELDTRKIYGFMQQGVAFANANYPLIDDTGNTIVDSLEGAARAIQYLRCHSNNLNLDPSRIGVLGASAGGGISLWLAAHDDLAVPNAQDMVLRYSTKPTVAAGNAVQSTYDFVRWEDILAPAWDVFVASGELRGTTIEDWGGTRVFDLYGISSFAELHTPAQRTYRANIDYLALMDANDSPICISNTIRAAIDPNRIETFDILHDPLHAKAIIDRIAEVGLAGIGYGSGEFYKHADPSGESCTGFLLRHLQLSE